MASKRTFYRTRITIEVLSEEEYDPQTLEQIAYDIDEGGMSGTWDVSTQELVDGPTMARLLLEQASEPEFFQLDDEGNDLEEEEDTEELQEDEEDEEDGEK